ncbi:Csu type fimbrial protein [Phyllobacterium meliloti]|uniref:Csu type fimbrial protein n=1 Tax=Phyllobacterium meliloti TaxID=555317 RepID=UPI001D15D208|nr:spore coat U domain-containing protein [Phyllobacterium sp. T1293]UGX89031.1 spore coat U domain-containing protein [Phyllobacterium sp. T1293]
MKMIIPILTAAAIGWSGTVYAAGDPAKATTAGNLDVQITISNDCSVSNVDSAKAGNAMLNFGEKATLEKLIEANTSTNVSAVQITCSKGTTYNIGLGKGLYYDKGSRRMAGGGGAYIPYDLYRSASDTIPWGTDKSKDTLAVTTTTDDETQPITIYGKVPTMATKPAAGLYKDTVAISVVF